MVLTLLPATDGGNNEKCSYKKKREKHCVGLVGCFGRGYQKFYLHSLELVEDGLGELVGGRGAAHVGGADLAVEQLAIVVDTEYGQLTPQQ